jgi:hypothetical protein
MPGKDRNDTEAVKSPAPKLENPSLAASDIQTSVNPTVQDTPKSINPTVIDAAKPGGSKTPGTSIADTSAPSSEFVDHEHDYNNVRNLHGNQTVASITVSAVIIKTPSASSITISTVISNSITNSTNLNLTSSSLVESDSTASIYPLNGVDAGAAGFRTRVILIASFTSGLILLVCAIITGVFIRRRRMQQQQTQSCEIMSTTWPRTSSFSSDKLKMIELSTFRGYPIVVGYLAEGNRADTKIELARNSADMQTNKIRVSKPQPSRPASPSVVQSQPFHRSVIGTSKRSASFDVTTPSTGSSTGEFSLIIDSTSTFEDNQDPNPGSSVLSQL